MEMRILRGSATNPVSVSLHAHAMSRSAAPTLVTDDPEQIRKMAELNDDLPVIEMMNASQIKFVADLPRTPILLVITDRILERRIVSLGISARFSLYSVNP